MSFTQQFEQDSALGCVCDFDVPCPAHPAWKGCRTGCTPTQPCQSHCGLCEYACHCTAHNYRSDDCEDEVAL